MNLWEGIIKVSFGFHLPSFTANPTQKQVPRSQLFVSLGFVVFGLFWFWFVFFFIITAKKAQTCRT